MEDAPIYVKPKGRNGTGRATKARVGITRGGKNKCIANQSILVTVERLAAALGLRTPGEMSDAARSLQIILKVKAFAGTQFDAIATSSDIGLSAFLLELIQGLKRAAWIEIDPSNIGAIHQEQAVGGGAPFVKIHVDAIRDFKLLEAAKSLASALNEEGIAATVLETEIGIASENTIHILVGRNQGESSV